MEFCILRRKLRAIHSYGDRVRLWRKLELVGKRPTIDSREFRKRGHFEVGSTPAAAPLPPGGSSMRLALAFFSVAAILAAPGRVTAAMRYRPYQSIRDGYSLVVPAEWEQRQEK